MRKVLTPLADKLEREFCEKALLKYQIADSGSGKHSGAEYHERESKESIGPPHQAVLESETPNADGAERGRVASEKGGEGSPNDLAQGEHLGNTNLVPEDAPTPADTAQRREKGRKGDVSLLGEKHSVDFRTAQQFLGMGERQRQSLMKSGALVVEGQGLNRKLTTKSLKEYVGKENLH